MTARTEATPRHHRPEEPESRHGATAQLLIAWSPLSVILAAYWVAQWVTAPLGTGDDAGTNRLGAGLHVLGPARGDEALGTVPTVWLQHHLVDGSTHWWDAVAALVYVTRFVSIPVLTAVLTMSLTGVAVYLAYPSAPPWLASERGEIGDVARISHAGWDHLHLDGIARLVELGQSGSNPVAAMPSLHAGAALVDVPAGWLVATLAAVVARAVPAREAHGRGRGGAR